MMGLDDGIDSLFRFTRPVTGAYYWCPPVAAGADRALGLR
jgi:putative iron-dependent peroxidase